MAKKKTETTQWECLSVTQVKVFPFTGDVGHLKAVAHVVLNDQFIVRGIRVMDSTNGLYVDYPFDPFYKGEECRSVCNPITRALREHIENCVLEAYQHAIE